MQNRATDHLLRLLERDPSALIFLAEHMGTRDKLPARIPAPAPWQVAVPHSLASRIHSAAEHEGVHPDAYVATLLVEQVAAQEVRAKIESIHETLLSMDREWKRASITRESVEPWKREYENRQQERGYAHAA